MDGTRASIPQMHIGSRILKCHQGKDRYIKVKERRNKKREEEWRMKVTIINTQSSQKRPDNFENISISKAFS